MHLLLTDILTCPDCGPDHGLILRADAMVERRVLEGALGCPNCRRNFPIEDGTARLSRAGEAAGAAASATERVPAVRIAALLGLDNARGFSLLAGPAAASAAEVHAMAADAPLIVTDTDVADTAAPYASRLVIGHALPFRAAALGAIWLSGASANARLEDAVRALHRTGRLVLEPAPADARERLEALGMRVALNEQQTVLAVYAGS